MKKILLILFFPFLIISTSHAQKKLQFYTGFSTSIGHTIKATTLEIGITSYDTSKDDFAMYQLKKEKISWNYGFALTGGLVIGEQLLVGTGLKYVNRFQDAVYNDPLSDYFLVAPTNLNTQLIEIPLQIQYNFIKGTNFYPFVSGEIYWSKLFYNKKNIWGGIPDQMNYFGYKIGAGLARNIGKNILMIGSKINASFGPTSTEVKYRLRELLLDFKWLRKF